MAIRLDVIRHNVRMNLGDLDLSPPVVSGFYLDQAISRLAQTIIARGGHPCQWNTSFKTLVAGTSEYTCTPTTGEFHTIALFRLANTGQLVEKVSPEFFERMREGVTVSSGGPIIATLIEGATAAGTPRTLTLRVYPTPNVADTLQALVSEIPLPVTADSDGIPLSEVGGRQLELRTSAECLARMTEADAVKLNISKEVGGVWLTDAENLRIDEQKRQGRLGRGRQMNRSIPY